MSFNEYNIDSTTSQTASSRPKKRNKNKPKSAKRITTTPLLLSTTLQLPFNSKEREVRVSAMEDSSNGKVESTPEVESIDDAKDVAVEDVGDSSKPVQVESVKVLEINDDENPKPESKRGISILEEIAESAEKLLDGGDSSSSSSEEEEKAAEDVCLSNDLREEAKVGEDEKEEIGGSSPAETGEKTLSSLVGVEETELHSSDEAVVTGVASKESEEEEPESTFLDPKIDQASPVLAEEVPKGIEDNKTGETSQVVYEAASGNADHNSQIPENTENPSVVSVTRAPLQPTSWKSCCGLFEALRRSDR